jgi:hypothetical protein
MFAIEAPHLAGVQTFGELHLKAEIGAVTGLTDGMGILIAAGNPETDICRNRHDGSPFSRILRSQWMRHD